MPLLVMVLLVMLVLGFVSLYHSPQFSLLVSVLFCMICSLRFSRRSPFWVLLWMLLLVSVSFGCRCCRCGCIFRGRVLV